MPTRLCDDESSGPTSRGPSALAVCDYSRSRSSVLHWYPVYSHPSGPSREPWYVVGDALAFRSKGHPEGHSTYPSFRLVDDQVYPTEHHEAGASKVPWFTMRGTLIYPTEGHPNGPSDTPWYQAR